MMVPDRPAAAVEIEQRTARSPGSAYPHDVSEPAPFHGRAPRVRDGAERSILLLLVAFVVAVVSTRWFLQSTGYPQVGGGELHVAHLLWGGLLLVLAVGLLLVLSATWVTDAAAILAGVGTGLFIDEVGKFITASNDYFYPLAAPIIYGFLLAIAVLYLALRRRPTSRPVVTQPGRLARWEDRHLGRVRYRRILGIVLLLTGAVWTLTLLVYLVLDDATIRELITQSVTVPGDPVERPSEPLFYALEAIVIGASGALLMWAGVALVSGRDRLGSMVALIGLVISLTAGTLVSLYVEQITAMSATITNAVLLGAVVHFRHRHVDGVQDAGSPDPR